MELPGDTMRSSILGEQFLSTTTPSNVAADAIPAARTAIDKQRRLVITKYLSQSKPS
jgi:hypothetical protein